MKLVLLAATIALLVLLITLAPSIHKDSNQNKKTSFEDDVCILSHETYELSGQSKLGNFTKWAVAVDNEQCSHAGKEILSMNGSAVDAAIASALCNGLVNPQSAGLGGGHFMVIYLKKKNKAYAIDAREAAPISSDKLMFANKSSLKGGLASGIPGEIYGFWQAHQLGGKLPWKSLFQQAIKMCREGFKVSKTLSLRIKKSEADLKNNEALSEIFINPVTNTPYGENDTIKMPNLANTLEIISEETASSFYNGKLTRSIVAEINENGGNVTLKDFRKYKALVKEPVEVALDDNYRVFTQPLPSAGIVTTLIMRIMREFAFDESTLQNNSSLALFYHRLIEAQKYAFAQRSLLGDEQFEDMTQQINKLLDHNFVRYVASRINDTTTFPSSYYNENDSFDKEDHGTAHISVLANGDAVSLTSTINTYFGAKYAGKNTGIIYNNQMDDFSTPNMVNYFGLRPSEANFIKPGKRPMSSMSPIIVVDKYGNVRLVLGASGGSKIISAVSQVAIKNLWMNMNIKLAIDDRRVHHQVYPEYVEVEEGFDYNIQTLLRNLKHDIRCLQSGGSVVQGIAKQANGVIQANCDVRKGGEPDGV